MDRGVKMLTLIYQDKIGCEICWYTASPRRVAVWCAHEWRTRQMVGRTDCRWINTSVLYLARFHQNGRLWMHLFCWRSHNNGHLSAVWTDLTTTSLLTNRECYINIWNLYICRPNIIVNIYIRFSFCYCGDKNFIIIYDELILTNTFF